MTDHFPKRSPRGRPYGADFSDALRISIPSLTLPSAPKSPLKSPLRSPMRLAKAIRTPYKAIIWLVPAWLLLLIVTSKQLRSDGDNGPPGLLERGDANILGGFGFSEEDIVRLPVEHVNKMVESYSRAAASGMSKVVIIHVENALSDRIQAYLSAKAFALATGRYLRVIWIPSDLCNARFSDLFDTKEDVTEAFEVGEIAGLNFATFDYLDTGQRYKLIEDDARNVYVRSAYILNTTRGSQDADVARLFQDLEPVAEVRAVLQQNRTGECSPWKPAWAPCIPYVGVDMRPATSAVGESPLQSPERYQSNQRNESLASVHDFIYGLRGILAQDPSLKVFVARATRESVRELEREFGDIVFHVERPEACTLDERHVTCQRADLTELLMLGHSSYPAILSSFRSSFTELAARLESKRVQLASTDFVAPGLAPLVCNQAKEDVPVFQGVSICVALTPSRTDLLLQALPTWLAARGIDEVVVLDYMPGNDTTLTDAMRTFTDPRLKYVEIEGTGKFVITRAYNLAVRHSRGSRIAKLESDNMILPDFVAMHPPIDGAYYAGNWKTARSENERHLNGVYFMDRELWFKINGFDERIVGYGHDDDNMDLRLGLHATRMDLNTDYIHHIEHGDSRRAVMSDGIQFMDVSILYNAALTERLPLWGEKNRDTRYECLQEPDGFCDCTVTAPADTIHTGLTPEDERVFLLEAYRQVTVYSANLPPEHLKTVDSISWFEKQLQIHYFKDRREWVVLRPMGTCADRAAAISSGQHLATKLGRPFRVIWQTALDCNSSVSDLFAAELDVVEEFFEWEVNWKYKEYDITWGPLWILPTTTFPKKSLFITANGLFGDPLLDPKALEVALQSLTPRAQPEGLVTEHRLLIVDIPGTLPERLLLIARSVLVSYGLRRRLVVVWDPVEVGGVLLTDILESPYLVLLPEDILTGLPNITLPLIDVPGGDLEAIAREENSHIRIRDARELERVEVHEGKLNTDMGRLEMSFAMRELTYQQMVGRTFQGLLIDDNDSCGVEGIEEGIRAAFAESNVTGGAYFAAVAPLESCRRLRARGVVCQPSCHAGSSRECHLDHLAMTLALAQSKMLYFTSWAEKAVDWILRRGLNPKALLECPPSTSESGASVFRPALRIGSETEESSTECSTGRVHLIAQYPLLTANRSARQAEYTLTLQRNLAHPQIASVHLFLESPSDEGVIRAAFPDPCHKLHFVQLGRRLFYNDSFAYANENLSGEICAIANSDISFASGLDMLSVEKHLEGGKRVLALSRHEETENDVCGRNMCYRYEKTEFGFLSSDAFVFIAPLPQSVVNASRFGPQPGSENVIIWALKKGGLEVRNPCRSVRVFHNHCSGDRVNLPTDVTSWETDVEEDARIDVKLCGEQHCGNGYCEQGAEVLEDLEEEGV